MTTQLETVAGLLARVRPQPLCDACIADRLGEDRATVAKVASGLPSADYERRMAQCSFCRSTKLTTRAIR